MKKWLGKNKIETFLLLVLVLLAAFVRFYRIGKLGHFVYDQARDALYIKRMIVDHKFRLIGTQSSIPGLYTGPAYYYLMLPFLWAFKLNPVGIDVGVALLGLLTVGLLYWLAKVFSRNYLVAWLTALIFAVQPEIVSQSRFAWNPNATPFFSLFFVFGLYLVVNKKVIGWLITFFSLAVLLQLHYSAVCFLPGLVFFLVVFRKRIKFNRWFLIGLLLFFFLMSPLVLFDLRHGFTSLKAIAGYLERGAPGKIRPPPFFSGLLWKLKFLLVELVFGLKTKIFTLIVLLAIFITGVVAYLKEKKSRLGLFLSLVFLVLGVLMASFYQGGFFNFYLTFLYPFGFLLLAILMTFVFRQKAWIKVLVFLLFGTVFVRNLQRLRIFTPPKRTIDDLRMVANFIAKDIVPNQPFNLAGVLGGERFDYNAVDYRYFLETYWGKKALDWEPRDYEAAETLYLISNGRLVDPLDVQTMEVSKFRPTKILETWELPKNIVIYKLIK